MKRRINENFKRIIAVCLIGALTLAPVYGSSIKDKKNELSSVKDNIEEAKDKISANKEKQDAIQAEIQKMDKQMVVIQDKILELDTQLATKEKEIAESEVLLEEAIKIKDEQYEKTKQRMTAMYKNQKVGYIQIIFSSTSFWEALNRIEYIQRISKQDNKLLDDYEAQIVEVERQKKKIEEEKAELDLLRKQQVAKKSELEEAKSVKDKALSQLAKEKGYLEDELQEAEMTSKELEEEIKRLTEAAQAAQKAQNSSVSSKYTGGAFLWPVPGFYYLSSEYNPRNSPISGNYEFHTGIDIPASYGSDVVAAADGVVITSGWVNGYGYTVMISHGGGLVTLYGHNSSLVVQNGQSVTKGQTIAKVGSTGYSTGNHCHFEVRVNGSHTTPWNYLNR